MKYFESFFCGGGKSEFCNLGEIFGYQNIGQFKIKKETFVGFFSDSGVGSQNFCNFEGIFRNQNIGQFEIKNVKF